jgi:hypothetical protein
MIIVSSIQTSHDLSARGARRLFLGQSAVVLLARQATSGRSFEIRRSMAESNPSS